MTGYAHTSCGDLSAKEKYLGPGSISWFFGGELRTGLRAVHLACRGKARVHIPTGVDRALIPATIDRHRRRDYSPAYRKTYEGVVKKHQWASGRL